MINLLLMLFIGYFIGSLVALISSLFKNRRDDKKWVIV